MGNPPAATVLVIEDHDSVRIAMSRFLANGGFQVLEAASTDAARKIWTEHASRISLLIVDIDLASKSGPDLVEELLKKGPEVPVIFATATDNATSTRATGNFPNPIILQKPFTPEVLVKAVRDALSSPAALSGFTTFFKRTS